MKEIKILLSQDKIEDNKLRQLRVLCNLLREKQQTLKALDKVILGLCPTEGLAEDDEISVGITEVISECEHLEAAKG